VRSRNRNFGILWAFIVFFFGVYLLAAEFITTDHSKGEVLIFRRKFALLNAQKKEVDEESPSWGKEAMSSTGRITPSGAPPTTDSASKDIFHWKDVCYDITIKGEPRRILDHVDAWVEPGKVTALMVGNLEPNNQAPVLTLDD